MDFISILLKMVQLFCVIILGFVANKCGIFDRDTRVRATKIVINITMPAMMLASVADVSTLPKTSEIVSLLVVAMSAYFIWFLCAMLVPVLLRVKKDEVGIYRFMMLFGNVGFIGYPVTQAVFGDEALFYTTVFNLPFNVLAYSLGVYFLLETKKAGDCVMDDEGDIDSQVTLQETQQSKSGISLSLFLTPAFISSVIVICIAFFHIDMPDMIGATCDMVGAVTTPMALMIIGSTLADIPVSALVGSRRVYLMSLLRMFVVPLVVFLIYRLFVRDPLLLGVCVIITAMPVATNGAMLCLQYDRDEKVMAQGTFITTVLSVFTIPLFAILLSGGV